MSFDLIVVTLIVIIALIFIAFRVHKAVKYKKCNCGCKDCSSN